MTKRDYPLPPKRPKPWIFKKTICPQLTRIFLQLRLKLKPLVHCHKADVTAMWMSERIKTDRMRPKTEERPFQMLKVLLIVLR